jgi:NifU-like protein involved in Fe-S cluster formation
MSPQPPDLDGFPYGPAVLDHFQNPRNSGVLQHPDLVGEAGNPVCGDRMRLYLRIVKGRVAEARFQTFGCSVAIAASSVLTELVMGKSLAELQEISNRDIVAALGGLPEAKVNCSVLAEEALRSALGSREGR